jgi:hypothetical protein
MAAHRPRPRRPSRRVPAPARPGDEVRMKPTTTGEAAGSSKTTPRNADGLARKGTSFRAATLLLLTHLVFSCVIRSHADQIVVSSFSLSGMTWSCSSPFPYYHVEWSTNLNGNWHPLAEAQTTNLHLNLAGVPKSQLFLRVVGATNSWFYKGLAVSFTGETNFGFRGALTNGSSFVALTEQSQSGEITRIKGAV